MPYKKLIETALPTSVINQEAEREKTARGGMPSGVHMWWSRRPMAAARSTIFASIVDDPAEHPELYPTEEAQRSERKRLLQMIAELAKVENDSNEELLTAAKKEIMRYAAGMVPTVYDPFVGGGAIPVEAQRLGLKSEAADLNPVAVMITKLVADIPARFSDTVPVHPRMDLRIDFPVPGVGGFAEDVQYYGNWILAEAREKIGYLYPDVISPDTGKDLQVSTWIWARTVKCPNPSCGCEIPLSSSYDLAKKKGSEAWVEPITEDGAIRFRIHREPNTSGKVKPKVAQTAVFKCPVCGEITPDAYVKECGVNHQIHSQLIAIVADEEKKRLYMPSTPEHEASANVQAPVNVPHGALPIYPRRFAPPSFGLTDYADLFTNRQLVFLTTMMQLAREAQDEAEKHAAEKGFANDGISFAAGGHGALAYAEAVRMALVLTVSKLLDRCSNICSWDSSGGGSLRNVFSRAAMPMIWDYAEANPFASASGSFANALARTCESIAALPAGISSNTVVHDGTLPNQVRDAILNTELPFYDKAGYADLSDFFYVWLRYGLGDIYPDYFRSEVTAKKEELTAFSYRWSGDKAQANAFYVEGMHLALKNLYESASDEYPSTIAFQYKGNDARADGTISEWEAFVSAVANAGFTITASWPLARKYEVDIPTAESRGIPITVIVRKKNPDASQTTRRYFVAAVKRELPEIVSSMLGKVDIMDLRSAVIGRALNIYTRYSKVLDADGTAMRAPMASRIIEQELDTILFSIYGADHNESNRKEEASNGRES